MNRLSQLECECAELLKLRARLEEMTVRSAALRIKKSPEYVRANFGVIVHGPKSHHVRVVDVEAYQENRTVWPTSEKPRAA